MYINIVIHSQMFHSIEKSSVWLDTYIYIYITFCVLLKLIYIYIYIYIHYFLRLVKIMVGMLTSIDVLEQHFNIDFNRDANFTIVERIE